MGSGRGARNRGRAPRRTAVALFAIGLAAIAYGATRPALPWDALASALLAGLYGAGNLVNVALRR